MKTIKVLLVDDHELIREGIKNSLIDHRPIQVIGEAQNGEEALSFLDKNLVDVVLMDISMPIMGGITTTQEIVGKYPDVNVIILTMHNEVSIIQEALKAGALGYLLKNTNISELKEAITQVYNGGTYFSSEISEKIMNQLIKGKADRESDYPARLTKREIEILKLISEEYSNQEIAEKLFISHRTVDTHRRNLIQKLNAKNTAGLVKFALKNKIIDV
ncbi:MAG: response regulator transcription factor [Algoriphagus sp.]|jgi:DNA-binding NarL/FixJ family response regulator|uniref:response regulator n=1 Tax=Algoriphagus sp. TaxID=1872435 RepID=UPI00262FFC0C|nr:response regulator transcription factor [Algoriphagus sp.]MDG1276516.1 response regulator transcription factor [Algoriphagus sp.]